MQVKNLVEFWKQMPSGPPYIHPSDLPVFQKISKDYGIDHAKEDFDSFLKSLRFGDFSDYKFHFSLLPIPYIGNLKQADIFILLLNPGFGLTDYYAEYKNQDFRSTVERNIYQNLDNSEFHFYFLNPKFCWHGGYAWWEGKFRQVGKLLANEKHNGDYQEALRELSKRVAAIEIIPYHSRVFKAHSLIQKLPSSRMAIDIAQNNLIPRAKDGEITVIITRQSNIWGASKSSNSLIVYSGGQQRGASLGIGTAGGKGILSRLGIDV